MTAKLSKGQNPTTSFISFPVASLQHKRQVRNKLVWVKVCCVMSFPKLNKNDLLPTSWQLPRLWGSYGETFAMDYGQNKAILQCVILSLMYYDLPTQILLLDYRY